MNDPFGLRSDEMEAKTNCERAPSANFGRLAPEPRPLDLPRARCAMREDRTTAVAPGSDYRNARSMRDPAPTRSAEHAFLLIIDQTGERPRIDAIPMDHLLRIEELAGERDGLRAQLEDLGRLAGGLKSENERLERSRTLLYDRIGETMQSLDETLSRGRPRTAGNDCYTSLNAIRGDIRAGNL